MADKFIGNGPYSADDEAVADAKSWDLPVVQDVGAQKADEGKTNVLGKPRGWVYEPPEPEPEPPKPPTLEEIEAIQTNAREEGFAAGKQEGIDAGLIEGREQGQKEGFEAGHAEGLEQGIEQGQSIIEEKAAVWQQLIEQLHQPQRDIDQQVEAQLIDLAGQLAKAVVKVELQTNPQIVLNTLKEAIQVLPINATQFEIYLNPDDIELVKAAYGESELEKRGWRIIAEPAMQRGGCEIRSDLSSVTYTIEERISEILDSFLQETAAVTSQN